MTGSRDLLEGHKKFTLCGLELRASQNVLRKTNILEFLLDLQPQLVESSFCWNAKAFQTVAPNSIELMIPKWWFGIFEIPFKK